ncbi:hypothetical protein COCON_G00010200 [Conger conger]|uniref:Uncharacterized protein n=1 Tax=Conger conger TaxID=82655 RepID=A0A9Q1I8Z8_CONCO|nr:hypothetical protein COCON_G00010200 [Conger conger]
MLKDLRPSTAFISIPAREGSIEIQAVWTDGHLITDNTGTQHICPDIKSCIPALLPFLHYSYHARRELRTLVL